MPHLEIETYTSQFTWIFTVLLIVFILTRFVGIPKISNQIKLLKDFKNVKYPSAFSFIFNTLPKGPLYVRSPTYLRFYSYFSN